MQGNPMQTLDDFAARRLSALEKRQLSRVLHETGRDSSPWVMRGGRRMLSLSCNDYLNLSTHPATIRAAIDATAQFGVGAGGSRLVTGNHPLYTALEARLAALKGSEAAIVFGSGFLANIGIIPALIAPNDLILVDELAHACIHAGAALAHARTIRFPHNDMQALAGLLEQERPQHDHVLIVTDGVFSMDGDLAPMSALVELSARYNAWLMTDDAHGIGVLNEGHGSAYGHDVPLQMGTLSKAVGAYGGYLCASAPVVALIRNRARSFIYTTGLPPGTLAAAITALDLIASDPALTMQPLTKARLFTRLAGLPDAQSPIVPILLGSAEAALSASAMLAEHDYLAAAIRPPTVPAGTARLRLTFTALTPDSDIMRLAELIRPLLSDTAG
ncbi:8-amino-7-oxononanoate synthase [Granulibacter bethesdensis]|uniref:8-amino-7-oxononanoate synthase n=2 Tax=Granulibacter bethesdensis TaxID=364410 RepID=A0AAN0RCB9_9PROT|nr:8-amino-7-oxononanoate synthase [Granulibacter bethesdensis]